eukprot:TRINITY_DN11596_c0_g1_i7.p1 TRINITY_DN11596_c0_g1~~TRINITY_DN11596_c0_g1_i7.p1  ORF type:complete len:470 (+),score=109.62 TRINITY_DN11596_c0_g1_i7:138-1547(+)
MCTQNDGSNATQPDEPEEEEDTEQYVLLGMEEDSEPIELGYEDFTVGRGDNCTLTINDPTISLTHMTLRRKSMHEFELIDSSSNGTYLNNNKKKVTKGQAVELATNTEIVIKKSLKGAERVGFVFTVYPKAAPPEPGMLNLRRRYFSDFEGHDQLLGVGSFAKVYKGTCRNTGTQVAIKVVDKKKVAITTSTREHDIEDEFKILKNLKHPGVIQVCDVFNTTNLLYIVLERAVGGELFDEVLECVYIESDARHVFLQLVESVKYLHDNGVVHRDIKPENILVASRKGVKRTAQVVKLTDFGLSRLVGPQSFMQTLCGTPQYLAPEVLTAQKGKVGYGQQVDMWSLGVILYILVSGTMPFAGPTESCPHRPPVQSQVLNAQYTFPDAEWATLSEAVKNLIRWLLTKDPEHRATPDQVIGHSWMKGREVPNEAELLAVSAKRRLLAESEERAAKRPKGAETATNSTTAASD